MRGAPSSRVGAGRVMTAAEVVEYLTPDLRGFLGDLFGSPESIVQAAVQLLPFGSRSALQATGMVVPDRGSEPGIRLTTLGFEVIALAGTTGRGGDLDALVDRAAAIVQARRHR